MDCNLVFNGTLFQRVDCHEVLKTSFICTKYLGTKRFYLEFLRLCERKKVITSLALVFEDSQVDTYTYITPHRADTYTYITPHRAKVVKVLFDKSFVNHNSSIPV